MCDTAAFSSERGRFCKAAKPFTKSVPPLGATPLNATLTPLNAAQRHSTDRSPSDGSGLDRQVHTVRH
jgi:hypothetical protein